MREAGCFSLEHPCLGAFEPSRFFMMSRPDFVCTRFACSNKIEPRKKFFRRRNAPFALSYLVAVSYAPTLPARRHSAPAERERGRGDGWSFCALRVPPYGNTGVLRTFLPEIIALPAFLHTCVLAKSSPRQSLCEIDFLQKNTGEFFSLFLLFSCLNY